MGAVAVACGRSSCFGWIFPAATRGLPLGVANFFAADLWPGLMLWLAASISFVIVHAVAWSRQPKKGRLRRVDAGRGFPENDPSAGRRAMRYLVATVLLALPPFGITGWAQPITAAGVLFPGWGWWGLAGTAAIPVLMTSRGWPAAAIVLGGFWARSAASWTPAALPPGWKGVDLEHGHILGRDVSLGHQRDLIATVRSHADPQTRFVVLPESALGFWTPTVERLWRDGLRDSVVTVIGGDRSRASGLRQYSGSGLGRPNRNPLSRTHAGSCVHVATLACLDWAGRRRAGEILCQSDRRDQRVTLAPLICYEQLVVWPILQSMLHSLISSWQSAMAGGPPIRRSSRSSAPALSPGRSFWPAPYHGIQRVRRETKSALVAIRRRTGLLIQRSRVATDQYGIGRLPLPDEPHPAAA